MVYYLLTLLKEIPGVDAGYQVSVSKKDFEAKNVIGYSVESARVINASVYPGFVKCELDINRAFPFTCPECGFKWLFPHYYENLHRVEDWRGVDYYKAYGLECPECGNKVRTHLVFKEHI